MFSVLPARGSLPISPRGPRQARWRSRRGLAARGSLIHADLHACRLVLLCDQSLAQVLEVHLAHLLLDLVEVRGLAWFALGDLDQVETEVTLDDVADSADRGGESAAGEDLIDHAPL